MIALPERVRVGPMVYQIVTDQNELAKAQYSNQGYLYGLADHRNARILIDGEAPLCQLQDTLLHELEHCVNAQVGIPSHIDMSEEAYIQHTTSVRLDTLQRNPLLVAFLMQQEDLD